MCLTLLLLVLYCLVMMLVQSVLITMALTAMVAADAVADLRPVIEKSAARHGVDPLFMEAIIRLESGHAASRAARTRNNLAGIMGRKSLRRYASKEECVEHLASILGRYRAHGRITVAEVARTYSSNSEKWAKCVGRLMLAIRNGRWGSLDKRTLVASEKNAD